MRMVFFVVLMRVVSGWDWRWFDEARHFRDTRRRLLSALGLWVARQCVCRSDTVTQVQILACTLCWHSWTRAIRRERRETPFDRNYNCAILWSNCIIFLSTWCAERGAFLCAQKDAPPLTNYHSMNQLYVWVVCTQARQTQQSPTIPVPIWVLFNQNKGSLER